MGQASGVCNRGIDAEKRDAGAPRSLGFCLIKFFITFTRTCLGVQPETLPNRLQIAIVRHPNSFPFTKSHIIFVSRLSIPSSDSGIRRAARIPIPFRRRGGRSHTTMLQHYYEASTIALYITAARPPNRMLA
jgi:hypothetical protein